MLTFKEAFALAEALTEHQGDLAVNINREEDPSRC